MKKLLLSIIIALTAVWSGCNPPATVYINVDGQKISENELKQDRPDLYNRIRREYDDQILSALQEVAVQKLIEKAAKEEGVESNQYTRELVKDVKPPSDIEIEQKYLELKKMGRIRNEKLDDLRAQIAMFIRNQKEREIIVSNINALKKKYGYKVYRDQPPAEIDIAGEPVRNNPNGQVTIVEFTDFECPFCIRVQDTARQLREKYGDKIKWVFKDYPLPFHQNAMGAHIASNCVHKIKQDQFWNFFDALFSSDRPADILTPAGLRQKAGELQVNLAEYDNCIADPAMKEEVEQDVKEGQAVGVSGTPAFFINGRLLSGAQPLEKFVEMIDSEL